MVLALTVIMSAVTLVTFVVDKKRAQRGSDRVQEKTLLAMTALFGAAGAFVGRILAHHKTAKLYFSVVIWFALILQVLLIVYTAYLAFAC